MTLKYSLNFAPVFKIFNMRKFSEENYEITGSFLIFSVNATLVSCKLVSYKEERCGI